MRKKIFRFFEYFGGKRYEKSKMPRKRKRRNIYDYGYRNLVGEYGYISKTNTVVKKMGKTKSTYKNNYNKSKKDYKLINLEKKVKALEGDKDIKSHKTTMTQAMLALGTVQHLTAIAQGSNDFQREGDKIKIYSIQMSGSFKTNDAVALPVNSIWRLAIIIDRDNDGGVPALTEIWASAFDFAVGRPRLPNSFKYKRFTVIYDQQFVVNSNSVGNSGLLNEMRIILPKWYSDKYKHHVYFQGISAGDSDASKGSMWLYAAAVQDVQIEAFVDVLVKYTG